MSNESKNKKNEKLQNALLNTVWQLGILPFTGAWHSRQFFHLHILVSLFLAIVIALVYKVFLHHDIVQFYLSSPKFQSSISLKTLLAFKNMILLCASFYPYYALLGASHFFEAKRINSQLKLLGFKNVTFIGKRKDCEQKTWIYRLKNEIHTEKDFDSKASHLHSLFNTAVDPTIQFRIRTDGTEDRHTVEIHCRFIGFPDPYNYED